MAIIKSERGYFLQKNYNVWSNAGPNKKKKLLLKQLLKLRLTEILRYPSLSCGLLEEPCVLEDAATPVFSQLREGKNPNLDHGFELCEYTK